MRSRPFFAISLACLAAAASAQYPGAKAVPSEYASGFTSITPADCTTWLKYLAGPECQGRGTGQPGFQKAAEYMAARFKEFGLKPIGDNGTFFQNLPFVRSRMDPGASYFEINGKKISTKSGISSSFFSADATADAPIVFIKISGETTQLPESVELGDKIVIVATKNAARGLRQQLSRAGAKAVFYINDKKIESTWYFRRPSANAGRGSGRMSGEISASIAKDLAKALDIDTSVVDINSAAPTAADVRESAVPVRFFAKVDTEDIKVPNVVAMLEGSDPVLKAEYVGVGSHLDHSGVQNGTVYWGADDDGSGSTAVLAVAKAFTSNAAKPKRSIVFMAFCGEEMGLIGSGYYANNPILPLEKMTCELQLDMVGRNEESASETAAENVDTMHLIGSKRISTELHELVLKANENVNFKFEWDEEDVYTRSDHYNFAQKGVPIAFLFSGFHPDYHQPTDTVDKINFDKIASAAKLFYLVAQMAADKPAMLKRDVGK